MSVDHGSTACRNPGAAACPDLISQLLHPRDKLDQRLLLGPVRSGPAGGTPATVCGSGSFVRH